MDPDPEHSDYVYATQLVLNSIITSVSDPWQFGVDPDPKLDPRINASD
jgi:hypothetical protein